MPEQLPAKPRSLHRQETFRTAVRNNAAEFDAAAEGAEHNQYTEGTIDFATFCQLTREREVGAASRRPRGLSALRHPHT